VNKLKLVLLIILVAILVDFAAENPLPRLELKLFKFSLGQVPTFLLAYISLALGLMMGWVGHVLRVRKKRRQAARALAQEQQAQQSQPGQEAAH
jgi:uncharacterized integral membrane protein